MNRLSYNIEDLKKLCRRKKLVWKEHALERLIQRNIKRKEVIQAIESGEIIEEYITDKPFPSCLVFGYTPGKRPVHVVCSTDGAYIYIITAYIPDTIVFSEDLKTRREKRQ